LLRRTEVDDWKEKDSIDFLESINDVIFKYCEYGFQIKSDGTKLKIFIRGYFPDSNYEPCLKYSKFGEIQCEIIKEERKN
jgi:hypothetical protein